MLGCCECNNASKLEQTPVCGFESEHVSLFSLYLTASTVTRCCIYWWVKGGMSVWRGVLTPYRRRRQFVPDDLKDDKYWARRRKNNMAAKRSRDARRMKENQIALRAGYLEKEVSTRDSLCPVARRGRSGPWPTALHLKGPCEAQRGL